MPNRRMHPFKWVLIVLLAITIWAVALCFPFPKKARSEGRWKISYPSGDSAAQSWVIPMNDVEFHAGGVKFKFAGKYIWLYGPIRVEEE